MNNFTQLSTVFNALHDGSIEQWAPNPSGIILHISCLYRAQAIQPDFEYFTLALESVQGLAFAPWYDNPEQPGHILTDPASFLSDGLEILSAEPSDAGVLVYCHQGDKQRNYRGGTLLIHCRHFEWRDQAGRHVTFGGLTE